MINCVFLLQLPSWYKRMQIPSFPLFAFLSVILPQQTCSQSHAIWMNRETADEPHLHAFLRRRWFPTLSSFTSSWTTLRLGIAQVWRAKNHKY